MGQSAQHSVPVPDAGNIRSPARQGAQSPPHHTVIHVFVGKGTAFGKQRGCKLQGDFPDGTSNTILLIEAGEPVPWTKPQDLPYYPDRPLPDLTSLFDDGFPIVLADASRRWINKGIRETTLRAAITRNGGEELGLDWND